MDIETLAAAKVLMGNILPGTTAADEGKELVVDGTGKWVAGSPVSAAIGVDGTKLVIVGGNS